VLDSATHNFVHIGGRMISPYVNVGYRLETPGLSGRALISLRSMKVAMSGSRSRSTWAGLVFLEDFESFRTRAEDGRKVEAQHLLSALFRLDVRDAGFEQIRKRNHSDGLARSITLHHWKLSEAGRCHSLHYKAQRLVSICDHRIFL